MSACPFCKSEIIPMHVIGHEESQLLICCRLIPECGARFDLEGNYTGGWVGEKAPRSVNPEVEAK